MTIHSSMPKKPGNNRGFTLIETIVALSLSVLIVLGTTQVFIEGLRHIHGVRAQALLTSDAQYMVQMIRNELFGADSVEENPSDSSQIDITRGGTTKTLALIDGQARLDGIPITTPGKVIVTDLSLAIVGQSLRIEFTLNSGPRTNKTFTGQTTLAYRN